MKRNKDNFRTQESVADTDVWVTGYRVHVLPTSLYVHTYILLLLFSIRLYICLLLYSIKYLQ